MFKQIKKLFTSVSAVATLAVVSTGAHAAGLSDITGGLDLSGAKDGIIAVGVAIGGLLVVAIGVRYILGFLKRV
ncbi:major capsid protein [Pasteurella multocida]